jgi:crotonobetainyl-CoA:carnitine CoA-transferase CaiB-like acyl-CoA transferase
MWSRRMLEEDARMSGGSLAGLSVLELGRMVAAPYCAKLFADLGADVVKLEEPGVGDPARRRGPFPDDVPHPERSCLFLFLNTSKRSITLDLQTQAGRRIFRDLILEADVLIEDTAPGELERLELDYPRLAELNPRLVVTSITPFGHTGPHRSYRSHHLNIYHGSGHASPFYESAMGEDRAPPKAGGYLGEYDGGLMAAVGTLAAVMGSAASGRGQHLDVSNQEAMMSLERVEIARLANDPNPPPRGPAGGLTEAKDGYVMITPLEHHQWQGLIRAMGNPEWSKADWCQNEASRYEHFLEGRQHVQEWAAGLTRDEIYHRAQAEGAPTGPVRDVAEVRDWEQARARGFFAEIEHEQVGKQVYPTAPYRFSKTPWAGSAAPLLGQHNEEVYCDRLGYSRRDLARLTASGVI